MSSASKESGSKSSKHKPESLPRMVADLTFRCVLVFLVMEGCASTWVVGSQVVDYTRTYMAETWRFNFGWGMHLTPEAPRYGIRALEGYSPTLGGLESASPSGFKFSPRRAATRRNEPQASAPRPPPGDFPRAQAAAVADHKI